MQIWPNLQHTFACCFFSSLSKGFIFSGITAGVVLLLLVYWLLGLDHPTRTLVSRCSVNWGCSQLLCAIGLCDPSMAILRLGWMVGWDCPLYVELDGFIPEFIWSVSGVANPRAPWCHGFTTLVLETMWLVYHLSHGAGSSWVIPIWYRCVTEWFTIWLYVVLFRGLSLWSRAVYPRCTILGYGLSHSLLECQCYPGLFSMAVGHYTGISMIIHYLIN